MNAALDHSSLHLAIIRYIIDHGHAPSIDQLAARFEQPREVVVAALRALQEYHGVVLHPQDAEVWIIHPFACSPTNFWVRSATSGWWGNCAWCSMGIAALVGGDVTITTTLGGETEQVSVRLVEGELLDRDLLVHFPIPMRHAWDNVVYTCSTMLLFDSDSKIDDWCRRHRIPKGDVQPLWRVWDFARVWYGRHLDPDWRKWSAEEAQSIFRRFALSGPTWQLTTSAERF